MTLHLHHPNDATIAREEAAYRCSEATSELIMALMAEPDLRRRGILAAAACHTIAESMVKSLPGGQEAWDMGFGAGP